MYQLSPYALVIRLDKTVTFFSHGVPAASAQLTELTDDSPLSRLLRGEALSREELLTVFDGAAIDALSADGVLADGPVDVDSICSRTDAFFREYRLDGARDRLRGKHVLILGCGGIGTQMAWHMTALGVGSLTLVDFDAVEESNLNRQTVFDRDDIGKLKTEVLKTKLERVNPEVSISTVCARIDSFERLSEICRSAPFDLIVKSLDSPPQLPGWLDRVCREIKVPYVAGITLQNRILTGPTFLPGKSEIGWSDLIPVQSDAEKIHGIAPSFGPMLYKISAELAAEAFKVLTGEGELKYAGKIIAEDILTNTAETIGPAASAPEQAQEAPRKAPEGPSLPRILLSLITVAAVSAFAPTALSATAAVLLPFVCTSDRDSVVRLSFLTAGAFSATSFVRWLLINRGSEAFPSAFAFISQLAIILSLLAASILLICLFNAAVCAVLRRVSSRRRKSSGIYYFGN